MSTIYLDMPHDQVEYHLIHNGQAQKALEFKRQSINLPINHP
jgi:hypothetical protein